MLGRALRAAAAASLSAGLFLTAAAAPAAAATCALSAPATINVGTPFSILGSGFPANTSVDVSMTLAGGTPDEFTVQSAADGGFQIDMTPEPQDAGKTTVVASVSGGCTATAVFTVVSLTPSATPKPTAAASATPKPTASSTPTPKPAGATPRPSASGVVDAAAGGGSSTPPRTDVATAGGTPAGASRLALELGALLVLLGVAVFLGSALVRSARRD
jgi:hypothetical protein